MMMEHLQTMEQMADNMISGFLAGDVVDVLTIFS